MNQLKLDEKTRSKWKARGAGNLQRRPRTGKHATGAKFRKNQIVAPSVGECETSAKHGTTNVQPAQNAEKLQLVPDGLKGREYATTTSSHDWSDPNTVKTRITTTRVMGSPRSFFVAQTILSENPVNTTTSLTRATVTFFCLVRNRYFVYKFTR